MFSGTGNTPGEAGNKIRVISFLHTSYAYGVTLFSTYQRSTRQDNDNASLNSLP
jgi:hypothetical protein